MSDIWGFIVAIIFFAIVGTLIQLFYDVIWGFFNGIFSLISKGVSKSLDDYEKSKKSNK